MNEEISATSRPATKPLSGDEILAIHQGVELDTPQWFPDGSGIIFRSSVSGGSDFWWVAPEGGPARRLTVDSGGQAPRLSPDGRWLAYLSSRSGYQEVWLHPLASELGADDRQLTTLQADVSTASWAPDGQTMAISCNRYGSYDVFEIGVPDGTWRRLTSDPDRFEHYPVYLPAGDQIAFVRLSASWEDHEIVVADRRSSSQRIVAGDKDFFDYQLGRRFGHPQILSRRHPPPVQVPPQQLDQLLADRARTDRCRRADAASPRGFRSGVRERFDHLWRSLLVARWSAGGVPLEP